MQSLSSRFLSIAEIPGVIGWVHCSAEGEILGHSGDESLPFGAVLPYFQQVSSQIGESLGLDGLYEAQIVGRSVTSLYFPVHDGALGVLVQSKARLNEVLAHLEQKLGGYLR